MGLALEDSKFLNSNNPMEAPWKGEDITDEDEIIEQVLLSLYM